jgi:hypothetical protein
VVLSITSAITSPLEISAAVQPLTPPLRLGGRDEKIHLSLGSKHHVHRLGVLVALHRSDGPEAGSL